MSTPVDAAVCWPMDDSCLPTRWTEDYRDTDIGLAAQSLAEQVLSTLTLGRVGGCPITIRPCPQRRVTSGARPFVYGGGPWMTPYLDVDGQVRNYSPCAGPDCAGTCEIDLGTVIGRVDEIKVDGEPLDIAGKLAVIDGSILAWRGEEPCPFPATNDLSLADTEPGTWSITYLPAHPVDEAGARALALLAFEFAKALCNADGCKLPSNVTQVVRQGVSLTLVPGLFSNGQVGIREVDIWIRAWNPFGRKRPSAVFGSNTVSHRTEVTL